MKGIALFFPSLVGVYIYYRRHSIKMEVDLYLLVRYGIYALLINLCDMSLITYIIGVKATISDIESFGFFTKYTSIATFIAFCFTYIEEIIKKYISISFQVESKMENVYESVEKM